MKIAICVGKCVTAFGHAVLVCVLMSGCMPLATKGYKVSAERIPSVSSFSHSGTLVIDLPDNIRLSIDPPIKDALVSAMDLSIWIPAGHAVKLSDHNPTISADQPYDGLSAEIVGVGGYSFKERESSEKVSESTESLVDRELIGSTWNTHHFGEHEYSRYNFRIQFATHPPERFRVSLPPIAVDGRSTELPTLIVEYSKSTRWMGFNGSIN